VDEELTTAAHREGQRQFPGIQLSVADLARHVAAVGAQPQDLVARGAELYLAAGCLANHGPALAHFEDAYLAGIGLQVSRFGLNRTQLAALRQDLRVRLLAGPRPRLLSYAGRAPLGGWLRVVALRAAADLLQAERSPFAEAEGEEALAWAMAGFTAPDILLERNDLGPAFKAALEEAVAALTSQERTLLRLHFLDGHTVDTIGKVFQVHRATAARWLVTIRAQLFQHVRERLALELAPSSAEVRSVFRLLQSNLHLSMERLLRSKAAT
jgi:RNA polymerase sigma-70 factor (ECF subfamily)